MSSHSIREKNIFTPKMKSRIKPIIQELQVYCLLASQNTIISSYNNVGLHNLILGCKTRD